jgi:hydrogenase-4 component F
MLLVVLLTLPLLGSLVSATKRGYHPLVSWTSVSIGALEFGVCLELARECVRDKAVSFGPGAFLRADALSAVVALVVSGVAWISLWFGVGYMRHARGQGHIDDAALRRYYTLTHLFIFAMLLAVTANNVGVMWVAVEGTTIATALLIGLQHSKSSLEASWKYILIGSVGIALAFVGTVLGYFNFVEHVGETPFALNWTVLSQVAAKLNGDVLRLCFVFILIGYGTKAGLAPMYTWLPDAHSEAPAPISSMMSGSLLVVALYAILRWKVVVDARLGPAYSNRMLILIGTVSLAVAAVLLIRQASYKRMLAYSSVEHIGLMCLGFGLGATGALAALIQMLGHAAAKSMMFLLSGSILARYHSTRISSVRGLMRAMPWTGGLFLLGGLALLGMPPFGLFISELLLLLAGFRQQRPWLMGFVLLLLLVIFISVLRYLNRLLYGHPSEKSAGGDLNRAGLVPLTLNVIVLLLLGFGLPKQLMQLLSQAVEIVQR